MRKLILACLIIFPCLATATDLKPWYGRSLEFYPRATYRLQTFPSVASPLCTPQQSGTDHFWTASLSIPYANWSAETELTFASLRNLSFGLDNFSLTGRYIWLDDIIGDFVSMTTGLTLTRATRPAVHDIGAFHHGRYEIETTVSIGREMPKRDFWLLRWWTVFGFGIADTGSPWLRGDINWEQNFCNQHHFTFFVNSLWGLGNKNLDLALPFRGYGPIGHHSIDLGFKYHYTFDYVGTLTFAYARRLYARNFPEKADQFLLSFVYPFGL